jgi:hypothetical protein
MEDLEEERLLIHQDLGTAGQGFNGGLGSNGGNSFGGGGGARTGRNHDRQRWWFRILI